MLLLAMFSLAIVFFIPKLTSSLGLKPFSHQEANHRSRSISRIPGSRNTDTTTTFIRRCIVYGGKFQEARYRRKDTQSRLAPQNSKRRYILYDELCQCQYYYTLSNSTISPNPFPRVKKIITNIQMGFAV